MATSKPKKPKTNKTKDKLYEENQLLRKELKALTQKFKDAVSSSNDELGDSPKLALGLYKDGKNYHLVRIHYNPENDACKVMSKDFASRIPEASHMAQMNFEEVLSEEIFSKLEEGE